MCAVAQDPIETLSHQPLSNVLKERIFNILNMKHSFFGWHDIDERGKDAKTDCTTGYRWVPNSDEDHLEQREYFRTRTYA
jgi:CubicO group peptidase (beta-lactamase class C family)